VGKPSQVGLILLGAVDLQSNLEGKVTLNPFRYKSTLKWLENPLYKDNLSANHDDYANFYPISGPKRNQLAYNFKTFSMNFHQVWHMALATNA